MRDQAKNDEWRARNADLAATIAHRKKEIEKNKRIRDRLIAERELGDMAAEDKVLAKESSVITPPLSIQPSFQPTPVSSSSSSARRAFVMALLGALVCYIGYTLFIQ